MITEELDILLSRYDDPDLSGSERARLEEALSQDAQARAMLAQYRRLDEHLARLPDALGAVDFEQFGRGVRQALDASARPGRQWRRLLWPVLTPLAAAAAVLLIVLSGGLLVETEPSGPAAELSQPRVPRVVVQAEPVRARRLAVVELSWQAPGQANHGTSSSESVICVQRAPATSVADQPNLSFLF